MSEIEQTQEVVKRLLSVSPTALRAALSIIEDRFGLEDDLDEDLVEFALPSEGVQKAREADRYTFAPVYAPYRLDAHDEFMERDDLQKSFWGFSLHGDRNVRLQHTKIPAGRWVELVSWPYEHTCELTLPTGERRVVTLPAGTVYMGTIWEPWAWELVELGKVRGYSMGGMANRLYVDFIEHPPYETLDPTSAYR